MEHLISEKKSDSFNQWKKVGLHEKKVEDDNFSKKKNWR